MSLYHKKVYWKKWFDKAARRLFYSNAYSLHMYEHCMFSKNTHDINIWRLGQILDDIQKRKQNYYLYEVETYYHYDTHFEEIIKAVIRTTYDKDHDICIVFDKYKIRTAWLNNKNDYHTTLDYNKYYNPYRKKNFQKRY